MPTAHPRRGHLIWSGGSLHGTASGEYPTFHIVESDPIIPYTSSLTVYRTIRSLCKSPWMRLENT